MAWDDGADECDNCVVYNGFDGTDEELAAALRAVRCEDKNYCLSEISRRAGEAEK